MIASVSYNGVKLATSGDTVSNWKFSTSVQDLRRTWWTPEYNDTYWRWTVADTTGVCDVDSAPSETWEGLSYSQLISANGIAPASNTPQYGGNISRWISSNGFGINAFSRNCSSQGAIFLLFRATLNLKDLAEEPTCFSEHDGRSFLSLNTPIVHFPSIGLKSTTTRVVSFIGSAEASVEVWVDEIRAVGSRGKLIRSSILIVRSRYANM